MTIGIIGCGKMGQALTLGALRAGVLQANDLFLFDPVKIALDSLAESSGGSPCASLEELTPKCEALILCVKPAQVTEVLSSLNSPTLVVSIAAGVTLTQMECAAPDARVIRAMPNTPALVGNGAAAYSLGKSASPSDEEFAKNLLESVGLSEKVPEALMDAITGLSGSGPAYVYTMIEALADGGLLEGLPRDQALRLATQTVLGGAQMVAETGLLPAELRDRVTSPGGTTIAGLTALEDGGFRSTVIKAVSRATARSKELGQQ